MAHHVEPNGKIYVDTNFLNSVRGLPGVSIEHMGFGEFYFTTPQGRVEVDRMRGRDFPGQSGRSHQLYDDAGGQKAAEWLIEQAEKRSQSQRVAVDWNAPEFQEAVEVLKAFAPDIARILGNKTTIRKWNIEGARPSMTLEGNGASVTFTGRDMTVPQPGGWWSVQLMLVGDRWWVEVSAPHGEFAGLRPGASVMAGKAEDLDKFGQDLAYANLPLSAIVRGSKRRATSSLRERVIRLAAARPDLRPHLLPLVD